MKRRSARRSSRGEAGGAPFAAALVNYSGLSLEEAPPLSVPLRFFLSAPPFGIAAALLAVWVGPSILESRWVPATLAAVHLLTLGYLSMVMAGALLQLLPVLAGARVPHTVGAAVHGLLCAGTPVLAAGFLSGNRALLRAGAAILMAALGVLVLAAGRALRAAARRTRVACGLVLALAALAVTVGLAGWLAQRYLTAHTPSPGWVDAHLAWGLLGWVGLLLITVAHQVVPMLQVTPAYPAATDRWLVPALFLSLILWSAAMGPTSAENLQSVGSVLVGVPLAFGYTWFAAATLWLQHRRRRRLLDITVSYWQLAMGSLLLAVALWAVGWAVPSLARDPRWALLLGVLVIVGFAISVLHGMLCKILPFLAWLHLHRARFVAGRPPARIPAMKDLLPQRAARRQFRLQCLALGLLCTAIVWPQILTRPAAFVLAAAFAEFWRLTLVTACSYRRLVRRMEG